MAGLLALAGFQPSLLAGERLLGNAGFDTSITGWSWENWSAPGSTATFDAAENSKVSTGAAKSGSLKLSNAFANAPAYQQAVYTVSLPAALNFSAQIGFVSLDVKVAATSTARADGDYGKLELILRQGNNWEWVTLPGVPLKGNEWQRVTFQVPKTGADSIRALTLKVGDTDLLGPVTVNVDNIVYGTTPDDIFVTAFDGGVAGEAPPDWIHEGWSGPGTATFDPTDFRGRSSSGSLRLQNDFEAKPDGYQQCAFTYTLPGGEVDAALNYGYLNLDVQVDPASVARAAGDYGKLEFVLRNGDGWDWVNTETNGVSGVRLTDTQWHHLTLKIPPTANAVHHLTVKLGDNSLLGPVILRLDNITFTRNTAPPPPPKLAVTPSASGLSLVATGTDQYGRHNIYTADNVDDPKWLAFVDSPEPVSYSFTIRSFPDAAMYPGFQAHIFLVPGVPGASTIPDWIEPTMIFMDIRSAAGNKGQATFRIKTDQPAGNSELYAPGAPTVQSASVLGQWTLTGKGSIFTMTAPDGTVSAPIDIGAEAADLFAAGGEPRLRVYFGVQPNAGANTGQGVAVKRLEVKRGATVLVADAFDGTELDVTKWVPNGPAAGSVQFVAKGDAGYVVNWTIPDTGFVLQGSGSLLPGSWKNLEVTPALIGSTRQAIVPRSALPDAAQSFFRLLKAP